jgi:hypothetical protein
MRAAELVGTQQAERRVLRLTKPKLSGVASNTLVANIQIVMPGMGRSGACNCSLSAVRAGSVELRIPKLCKRSYFPAFPLAAAHGREGAGCSNSGSLRLGYPP